MNRFELIVDNISLDTYDDLGISLNYQIGDIMDIGKRNTNFSKTIEIPGTAKNNKFFRQIFDVNIDNINFNPTVRIPALIRTGDSEVFNGNLQLLNITNDNGEINYSVSVFGRLKNIIDAFGDFTLKNLNFAEFNHTRNKENIQNSWDYICKVNGNDTNLVNEGQGYVYPYIINGNSTDFYDNLYIYDMFPAFYAKTYIDKMFDFAGFTYTSNFLESEYFKQIVLPYTEDKLQLSKEQEQERKVLVSVNGTEGDGNAFKTFGPTRQIDSGWFYNSIYGYQLLLDRESGTVDENGNEITFTDELDQWDGSIFTCAEPGRYDIDFSPQVIVKVTETTGGNINFQEGEFEYIFRLQLVRTDGSVTILDSSIDPDDPSNPYGIQQFTLDSGDNTSPHYYINNQVIFNLSAEDVFLDVGDKIRVFWGWNYPNSINWQGTDANKEVQFMLKESLDGQFTKMDIRLSDNTSFGNEDLNVNDLMSDKTKIKDLFLDFVKAFNLQVEDNPDKPNDLLIEPFDDYYKYREVKDWTNKVDRDSTIKITPMSELDAKSYLYTYQKDEDYYNKEYEDETKRVYGDVEITVSNDFSEKTKKNALQFASTPNSSFQLNGRVAPWFVEKKDEGYKPKKVKNRMLFYTGLKDIPNGSLTLKDSQEDESGIVLTGYPYVGMWDDPTNPSETLEFGASSKIYWSSPNYPFNNLYNRFHRNQLKNITDKNSRLLEASFHLKPADIKDFKFTDAIFIDGSYWAVNKIKDYNPVGSDSLTKVVLFKLIDFNIINPYKIESPTNNSSCPNDLFVFGKTDRPYYKSRSGQPISEDCCSSLGGDYVNGACYVNPGGSLSDTGGIVQPNNPAPINEPSGTVETGQDNNSPNSPSVKIQGNNNYVSPGASDSIVLGNNNTLPSGVSGVIIIGDNQTATQSDSVYVNGIIINQDGIVQGQDVIIDGGEDEVLNVEKTNLIDIVDGGVDAVRNFGGDSKDRPIIDGGIDSVRNVEPK